MAAGVSVGLIVLFLGVTKLIKTAHRLVPRSIVRGIQLGVGLGLAKKGVVMMLYEDSVATRLRPWVGLDGLWIATITATFLLSTIGYDLRAYVYLDCTLESHRLYLVCSYLSLDRRNSFKTLLQSISVKLFPDVHSFFPFTFSSDLSGVQSQDACNSSICKCVFDSP